MFEKKYELADLKPMILDVLKEGKKSQFNGNTFILKFLRVRVSSNFPQDVPNSLFVMHQMFYDTNVEVEIWCDHNIFRMEIRKAPYLLRISWAISLGIRVDESREELELTYPEKQRYKLKVYLKGVHS